MAGELQAFALGSSLPLHFDEISWFFHSFMVMNQIML